ncbi:1-aminocyclopropane-1-carboxylate oxidase homolog 1-like [Andrographis paniculata]|uniref:1-aminocyclopropane-1-carboxylate oxidase homolog 1-like n=1 Tax=Andrographis paniculata TaxID=175694 RepID=UPI0021E86D46|nr:1-aminocyclopropane-1-carboxylate oxidase homolog 1-like [Andrographis paniculata]
MAPAVAVAAAAAVPDRAEEVKRFNEMKTGVKGLVDAGVAKLPRIFVHPPEILESKPPENEAVAELPTVDFGGRREVVVETIRRAASEWGFFRITNHGVPAEVTDGLLTAVRKFHEQPTEKKAALFSTDSRRRVRFNSNGFVLKENDFACWKDMLTCVYTDDFLDPEEIPPVCRREVGDYVRHMIRMRETLAELLSEGLGLERQYLSNMECMKSEALACLYYPVCPEPKKTLGTPKHSDTTFLTLLLQDVGGLQILHGGRWVDVPPVPGTLIANVGDLMQIISNDKFVSVEHRVRAQAEGARVSVACFFTPSVKAAGKVFAPVKELVSEENPAVYREFFFRDYCEYYKTKGHNLSALSHYRI